MASRTLYLIRHGAADAFGQITDQGREQSQLTGQRLAHLPIDVVWHSPVPRAISSAAIVAAHLPHVLVDEAAELVDHVPFVPEPEELSPAWAGFFDGYDRREAQESRQTADALTKRFSAPNTRSQRPTHEVAVTHAYPIAWLVREALSGPPDRWMSLAGIANAALTVIELNDAEPPSVVMVNDMTHLPSQLRWTGFTGGRPL